MSSSSVRKTFSNALLKKLELEMRKNVERQEDKF